MKSNKSIPVDMSEKAEQLKNIVEYLSEQPYFIQLKKEIYECRYKKIKFVELFEKWYVNDGYTLDRKIDYAKKIMWLFSTYRHEAILIYSEWLANKSNISDNVQVNAIRTIKNCLNWGLEDGTFTIDELKKQVDNHKYLRGSESLTMKVAKDVVAKYKSNKKHEKNSSC